MARAVLGLFLLFFSGCGPGYILVVPSAQGGQTPGSGKEGKTEKRGSSQMLEKMIKTEEEWKRQLTPEQFRVLRKKGTERAYSGEYWNLKEKGIYRCAGCGNELFSSETKYESGTGWPSFWAPISPERIRTEEDASLFMRRTEVLCSRCDGHLGHLFEDGPAPTFKRYCINSVSLKFQRQ